MLGSRVTEVEIIYRDNKDGKDVHKNVINCYAEGSFYVLDVLENGIKVQYKYPIGVISRLKETPGR